MSELAGGVEISMVVSEGAEVSIVLAAGEIKSR